MGVYSGYYLGYYGMGCTRVVLGYYGMGVPG